MAFLGTSRVEIALHFCPFTAHSADPPRVLHSSQFDRNVFAGVAKGFAPASFGEQEKEL